MGRPRRAFGAKLASRLQGRIAPLAPFQGWIGEASTLLGLTLLYRFDFRIEGLGRVAATTIGGDFEVGDPHALFGADVLTALNATPEGLTGAEAARRLAVVGPNRLPVPPRDGPLKRFFKHFHDILIYILLAAAASTPAAACERQGQPTRAAVPVASPTQKDIISDMILALDTDVLVAALRSPAGASRRLLQALRAGDVQAVATVGMFVEYEAVLTRPEHLIATGLTRGETERLLDGLAGLMVPVRPHFLWRPQLRDPNDEMVLEAAVNGRAEAIATFNRRDFLPAATRFGIGVELPGDLIRRLP